MVDLYSNMSPTVAFALLFALQGSSASKDCAEIKQQTPSALSGEYIVYVNGGNLTVYCDMQTQGGGWTVFQRRHDGSVDFFRDWATYVEGFGDVSREHWLGNEAIHHLTSTNQDLLIEMREWNRNCSLYALYANVSVASGNSNYRLSNIEFLEGSAGDSGNGLSWHRGMDFSTKDRDNDRHPGNCARDDESGGWWFNRCHRVNLNGKYSATSCGFVGRVKWLPAHGAYYSFPWTEMKIRDHS